MPRKVIVFEELLTRFPLLQDRLAGLGAEVVGVAGGRDAMLALNAGDVAAIVLDVAMPQMSGVECCRQIREGGLAPQTKLVLISSIESEAISQRARDAGCDQFLFEKDADEKMAEFLSQLQVSGEAPKPAPSNERESPRIEIQGQIRYWLGEKEYGGELINGSRTGLLFATAEPLERGSAVQLRLSRSDGSSCDFDLTIVRSVPLESPPAGLPHGAAGKFGALNDVQKTTIDELLSSSVIRSKKTMKLEPAFAKQLLEANVEFIAPFIRQETSDERIQLLLDSIRPFEQESFLNENPAADCVRRLVLMRLQCNAFRAFTPSLKADRGGLAHAFLPILSGLVQRTDAVEQEVENLVREAVTSGNEVQRQGLNEISSRLHEAKVKMLMTADSQISADGLGPEAGVLQDIKSRVETMKALQKGLAVNLKYDRRAAPPPSPKEEKKSDAKPLFRQLWFQVTFGIAVLTFVGSGIGWYLSTHVSRDELPLPLTVDRIVVEDEGLTVYTTLSAWRNIPKDEFDGVFDKTEAYMRDKKLTQAKFYDDKGDLLAAIASAKVGAQRTFSRRIKVR